MKTLIRAMTFVTVLSAPSLAMAPAMAQVVTPPSAAPAVECVTTGSSNNAAAPKSDRPAGETMSDKLAQSKGVICPPGSGDDIRVTPPDNGGRMRVIPPPVEPAPPK